MRLMGRELLLASTTTASTDNTVCTNGYKENTPLHIRFTLGAVSYTHLDVYKRQYGQFMFENESLEHIMNTLSLWYDVDVFYANERVKEHRFTGHMKKYDDIDTILDAISKIMGVTFTIKDKTITVMK